MEEAKEMKSKGSERFHQILKELGDLHDKKQKDYGLPNDPFANVRASERFGIPSWVGCMIRANDKMVRIQKAARGGSLSNETLEDSLRDLAVYAIIGLCLLEENDGGPVKAQRKVLYPNFPFTALEPEPNDDLDEEIDAAFARMLA